MSVPMRGSLHARPLDGATNGDESPNQFRERSSSESINEALIACIKACGGSKVVGPRLWPDKPIEAAQRLLLDCLNEERPQHLSPSQVVLVLRMARERGYHAGFDYLCETLSYAPTLPIDPRDEAAELRRQVLEMGRSLQVALSRLDQIEKPALRSAP